MEVGFKEEASPEIHIHLHSFEKKATESNVEVLIQNINEELLKIEKSYVGITSSIVNTIQELTLVNPKELSNSNTTEILEFTYR